MAGYGSARRHLPRSASIVPWVAALAFLVQPKLVNAKWVHGRVSLVAGQATVVTKFCFDFNTECLRKDCSDAEKPGRMSFRLSKGKRVYTGGGGGSGAEADDGPEPGLYVALLDDEYFSYPEVSQVWGEANCTDVLKASKKSLSIAWKEVQNSAGENISVPLIEKVRPRWWYIAFVSCSGHSYELSYSAHLENNLRGWQSEFSMDCLGILAITLLLNILFGGLALAQWRSLGEWRGLGRGNKPLKLHPIMTLLGVSVALSLGGYACWLAYYWRFMRAGEAPEIWTITARTFIIAAKTIMQIMLMLLAGGKCVCTPDISWEEHTELVVGMVVFGVLSLGLELWGDSSFWTTSTEFVYDTRPGVALVAFDVLWLSSFVSKSRETLGRETRLRPRRFYWRYGPIFALWFAALPLVAALGRAVAPWVRLYVTYTASGLSHVAALAALVHSFRPSVAEELYELRTNEFEAVNDEELDRILGKADDDDII